MNELLELIYDAVEDESVWVRVQDSIRDLLRCRVVEIFLICEAVDAPPVISVGLAEVFDGLFRALLAAELTSSSSLSGSRFAPVRATRLTLGRPEPGRVEALSLPAVPGTDPDAIYLAVLGEVPESRSRLMLGFGRARSDGPIPDTDLANANILASHISRALSIVINQRLERATSFIKIFNALNLPALTLSSSGRKLAHNAFVQPLVGSVLQERPGRVGFVDPKADLAFRNWLSTEAPRSRATSFALHRSDAGKPTAVHIVPLEERRPSPTSAPIWLLFMGPLSLFGADAAKVLNEVFDLTPAEARIATSLMNGLSANEISSRHGTTVGTVRVQIKNILRKTGTRRQTELIAMLSGRSS